MATTKRAVKKAAPKQRGILGDLAGMAGQVALTTYIRKLKKNNPQGYVALLDIFIIIQKSIQNV